MLTADRPTVTTSGLAFVAVKIEQATMALLLPIVAIMRGSWVMSITLELKNGLEKRMTKYTRWSLAQALEMR
jgi:hypothetical protein